MSQMSADEKLVKMQSYMNMCACSKCASYANCGKIEKDAVFCLKGPSTMCADNMMNCICTSCPVESKLMMKNQMYCLNGSEFETRNMDKLT
jgi:hypothetical protein